MVTEPAGIPVVTIFPAQSKLKTMKGLGLYMNRILTICLALIMLVAGSSFATSTRLLTLGQQYDIVMDDANIFRYPSRLLNYPKLAVAEFGYSSSSSSSLSGFGGPSYSGTELQKVGVHWQFRGEENPWILGTYFHNAEVEGASFDVSVWGEFDLLDYIDFDDDLFPNQKLDLFFAKRLGQNPFGLHLRWIHSSYSEEDAGSGGVGETWSEGFNSYKLALGLTMNEGNTDVAASIQMWSWSDKYYNGTDLIDETEPSGNLAFSLRGRHFMARSNNYTLVPHAQIMYRKHGVQYNDGNGDESFTESGSIMGITLGSGLNWTPAEDVLALLDGGIRYSKATYEDEPADGEAYKEGATEFSFLYLKLGAEAQMFQWMTVRAGATSNWNWSSFTEDDGGDGEYKYTANFADNQTYLGLGFLWGGWHIDTHVDPAWVLSGPYFVTGDANTMNWGVSVLRPF